MRRSLALLLVVYLFALPRAVRADAEVGVHGLMDRYSEGVEEHLDPFRTQGNGWTSTSSGPVTATQPAKITWSIVRNGTPLPQGLGELPSGSNLISFLDGIHHGGASPGGDDLTQRSWFPLFESSFERWDQLSGLTITYEPNEEFANVNSVAGGILGRRGDHRIGGHSIDGQISPTFLAYNYFPNFSDMVIDTDEVLRWGDPNDNYLKFRNMLMHEFGHGLGLQHVTSSDAQFLMEPFLAVDFEGPQLDDILGIQRLYGDANEAGAGNNTFENASTLGRFWPGQSVTIGSDAADATVAFDEVDFVSIHKSTDIDFYRFSILAPSLVDFDLTPLGPTYMEGPQSGGQFPFNTATMSDLTLSLWDSDGTSLLEFVDDGAAGELEEIEKRLFFEPGDYYVSVAGTEDRAQFYELGLATSLPLPTSGNIFANIVKEFARLAGFGKFFNGSGVKVFPVPEPATLWLAAICGGAMVVRRRMR